MIKRMSLLLVFALALPAFAAAQNWRNVSIIDTKCSTKMKADPDSHTRTCALACAKSGYGIVDSSGNYLRFDEAGNQKALKLLQSSSAKDHLRVNVTGTTENGVIHVQSLSMAS